MVVLEDDLLQTIEKHLPDLDANNFKPLIEEVAYDWGNVAVGKIVAFFALELGVDIDVSGYSKAIQESVSTIMQTLQHSDVQMITQHPDNFQVFVSIPPYGKEFWCNDSLGQPMLILSGYSEYIRIKNLYIRLEGNITHNDLMKARDFLTYEEYDSDLGSEIYLEPYDVKDTGKDQGYIDISISPKTKVSGQDMYEYYLQVTKKIYSYLMNVYYPQFFKE